MLRQQKIQFKAAPIYRTVPEDVSDLDIDLYDMLVFFSPFGIKSLKQNFPEFKQKDRILATFGKATTKAAEKEGFKVGITAPTKTAPSMIMAIQEFLEDQKKAKPRG